MDDKRDEDMAEGKATSGVSALCPRDCLVASNLSCLEVLVIEPVRVGLGFLC
jgi:hypothetical protein